MIIQKIKNNTKLFVAFFVVLGFRLLPVRPPNVEPILATIMPLSKKFGVLSGVLFSVLSIVVYDLLTSGIGGYTWSAALAYAFVALGSGVYLERKDGTAYNFVIVSIAGILFYDTLTGIILGPIVTGSSMYVAFIGQIPFTLLHLMGGAIFAIVLSPLLSKWFVASEKAVFETEVEATRIG